MKTFRDFDLSHYRKVVYEIGEEHGYSEKKLEKLLDMLLEKGKDSMETKIHCLTCGVKFPLNDLQHDCQEEDIWLYQYVKNSVENKELKRGYLTKLRTKYPLRKGNRMAFRGINFQTKEEYETFIKEIESGTYEFKEISSWSLNYSYAKRFATHIQKGTRKNDHTRKEELRIMFEQKANITGYKGVVLAIDLKKSMVLCDISEEYIGSMDEKEIVLRPGTYPVYIFGEIEKEYGKEWGEDVIQLVEQS
ncbi:hypothetical protein CVD28_00240 [Bacillus sp. M6-12]|uniref:hypothetical protein n=1 Tax=Bacillus sp. M6-12 TaxID=2054166 RepID=UPI000C76010F|nr:hypothetical protein [Bacillus sp. M6-12]PLS18864.1 hypothetical protein CVD28_00240 [Bacillus sp. M6-12]